MLHVVYRELSRSLILCPPLACILQCIVTKSSINENNSIQAATFMSFCVVRSYLVYLTPLLSTQIRRVWHSLFINPNNSRNFDVFFSEISLSVGLDAMNNPT